MTYDAYALAIHIDGSAYHNPGGSGGIAGIAEFPEKSRLDPKEIFQISFDGTTNNRMELKACIQAIEWTRNCAIEYQPARILIHSDSRYLIDNLPHARIV